MPLAFSSPPLTITQAHQLAGFFAVSYVGSLYLFKNARLSFTSQQQPTEDGKQRERSQGERWRDDPAVIRARLVVVSVSSALSCLALFVVIWNITGGLPETLPDSIDSTIARLGFIIPSPLQEAILPCLIAPVLFFAPLYVQFLDCAFPLQVAWSLKYSVAPYVCTWTGWRNVIMGPITEEVVFRGCIVAAYKLAGVSEMKMVFLTPLWFGLAHIHHAWETYNRYGRTAAALKRAVFGAVFQTIYTTLFGFHCAWLFVRTGSLLAPLTSHVFCNIMGLPMPSEKTRRHPNRKITILIFYVLGIVGYILTVKKWTEVKDNLYWRSEGSVARY
ncbi:hypothetical protein BXZ70DRAFT_958687 [Cristinia sonorae]|uniref:intramembrane prenyl-peptidase Rce1 n=1 Tax=Cristinia sonorae TaxID=1940300 RepID=A0A8K0UFY0_9AGAR|nr:hypothetical protein BXZ70DRAFT_958687 [Cristinia sonorae]